MSSFVEHIQMNPNSTFHNWLKIEFLISYSWDDISFNYCKNCTKIKVIYIFFLKGNKIRNKIKKTPGLDVLFSNGTTGR